MLAKALSGLLGFSWGWLPPYAEDMETIGHEFRSEESEKRRKCEFFGKIASCTKHNDGEDVFRVVYSRDDDGLGLACMCVSNFDRGRARNCRGRRGRTRVNNSKGSPSLTKRRYLILNSLSG